MSRVALRPALRQAIGMAKRAGVSYTFPAGTLFGEVERLSASADASLACGSGAEELPVEFVNNAGAVTISADTNWGNATADERLLAVRVRGNLTIDETKTLTAAARKLGLLVFVDGNLTVNGIIDMTARGANHSAAGSDLTAFDTLLYDDSADADNIWPAAGAAGAPRLTVDGPGEDGGAGANGQSGGGASGGSGGGGQCSGAGGDGTGYSGGSGGGGHWGGGWSDGADRGGRGGTGSTVGGSGAGNPAGPTGEQIGIDGTGGIIVLVVIGDISIGASGVIRANGSSGNTVAAGVGGGGSGAGAISIYHQGTYNNAGTVQANGGAGGLSYGGRPGGAGGAGSIRVVEL